MAWVETLSRFHWDLFGSLTFREDTHPESAFKRFRLFISMLNRKLYGPRWFKHNKGISWCVALETQRRGVVHFHCLLADPELVNLLRGSWFKGENGRWANELNEMWNELAGFARIEAIDAIEAVKRYVSKYVVKGGEIDLGGPLMQRRMEQAHVRAIVKPGPRGDVCLGYHSVSVPGLPGLGGDNVGQVENDVTSASNLSPFRGCGSRSGGLVEVAQEVSAHAGASDLPRMISSL